MNAKNLGRLEKVSLREAWLSESTDFTPWLAQEENLKELGEAIGIELELESQEKNVGPFRADILCKDTLTNDWVLIENQLERTNHGHLGQILTYAAGLNAVTIVWISKQFTEEHRAALDWLNEHTDEKINLFGLEIELWRIGNSPIAPKFNIISQPNDWSRTVQQEAARREGISPYRQTQLKYWTEFKKYMEDKNSFIKCQKPNPLCWTNHAIGRSGAYLSSVILASGTDTKTKGPEMHVELFLNGPNANKEYTLLEKDKDEIERKLGFKLYWHKTNKRARIYVRKDADVFDESLWSEQFEWLRKHLEKMYEVFSPILKNMDVEE